MIYVDRCAGGRTVKSRGKIKGTLSIIFLDMRETVKEYAALDCDHAYI